MLMIIFSIIFFAALGLFFYKRNGHWGADTAATSLLTIISICAIMIDVNDIYGEYGINQDMIDFPTVILYCIQWTLVLLPLHYLSNLELKEHPPIKLPLLYITFFIVAVSSLFMIIAKAGDIRDAMIMDMVDVRQEHYEELVMGGDGQSHPLLMIPQFFVSTPFPTLALFFWFYMRTFMKVPFYLRLGMLLGSIVQAVLAIITAGRSAIVFWLFDFFLLFSYFYRYMSPSLKRKITVAATAIGIVIGSLFITITISRFDGSEAQNKDAFASVYGYAGQHLDNFCTMMRLGADSPTQYDRIFPLISKTMGKPYDMFEHYETTTKGVNATVNVFDTFGAEIYLDLGWLGYISFFILLIIATLYIRIFWKEMSFYRIFILVIAIAFFTRGLFAWPFTGHYSTMAILLMLALAWLFKRVIKIC